MINHFKEFFFLNFQELLWLQCAAVLLFQKCHEQPFPQVVELSFQFLSSGIQ